MKLDSFLDKRLKACAEMVKNNSKLVDVGTDHAYLPIYLVLCGKINFAIATDINPLPLERARQNIKKYNLQKHIELRLADGLEKNLPNEADTVIIAGIGGELIANIIKNANWLKTLDKKLILQPMSKPQRLREFLLKNKFEVTLEKAVTSNSKTYSVMSVKFNQSDFNTDLLYPYIGKITKTVPESLWEYESVLLYIDKIISSLEKKLKGLKITKDKNSENSIANIILKLKKERQKYHDLYKRSI